MACHAKYRYTSETSLTIDQATKRVLAEDALLEQPGQAA
jgi:hypothetical protein